jgi:hypothetical protein
VVARVQAVVDVATLEAVVWLAAEPGDEPVGPGTV